MELSELQQHAEHHYQPQIEKMVQNLGGRFANCKGKYVQFKGKSTSIPVSDGASRLKEKSYLQNAEYDLSKIREVNMRTRTFYGAARVSEDDIKDLGTKGSSRIDAEVEKMTIGGDLTHDDLFIEAIYGSYEQINPSLVVDFPVGNLTPVDYQYGGGGSNSSLTYGKLVNGIKSFMGRNTIGNTGVKSTSMPVLIIEPEEWESMYNKEEFKSSDYKDAMQAAMGGDTGQFKTLFNCDLIIAEEGSLPVVGGVRECMLMKKEGLAFGSRVKQKIEVDKPKNWLGDYSVTAVVDLGFTRFHNEFFHKILTTAQ